MKVSLNSWKGVDDTRDISHHLISIDDSIKRFLDEYKISGNVEKTIKVFKLLGINLGCHNIDSALISQVTEIVNKRNDIIHRANSASDITLSDIVSYIDIVRNYMESIYQIVSAVEYNIFGKDYKG
ncbi:hypothetical protein C3007_01470 [Avibacterium gallinarum]|nr:hypothetical protein C3007_01470 [Avibacterium gallinarum]